jgi:ABC-2 type transport system ATP-binding protein
VAGVAIGVDGIGKRFKRYRERPSSIKQRLLKFKVSWEEFWALQDVSFDVPNGSTMGLIGANGSGKTTLLKIMAGILRPSEGRVTTRGRIAALLELGAGFHPELTGRENVYLNASILGLSRKETDRVFDSIVEFAELQDFIDNQVKFYSSGMYIRLGFAVAVHVDPNILLVDEVLAVGDESFQRKCLDRMQQFQREGRTIVVVTHAADLVRSVCDQAVMLQQGRIHAAGPPDDVVREFHTQMLKQDLPYVGDQGTREVEIVSAELLRGDGSAGSSLEVGETLVIQVDIKSNEPVDDPVVSLALHDQHNRLVFETSTIEAGLEFPPFDGARRVRFRLHNLPFLDGKYWVTLGTHSRDASRVYHVQQQHYSFRVQPGGQATGAVFIRADAEAEEL